MRWLVRRIFTIALICVLPICAVRWLGSFRENPAAEIFELDASQIAHLCWHQICLGRTTLAEAGRLLRAGPTRVNNIRIPGNEGNLCWDMPLIRLACADAGQTLVHDTDPINYITIQSSEDGFPVTLGDVIALLGPPTGSDLCSSKWSGSAMVLTTFSGGKVFVESVAPRNLYRWRIDPAQTVSGVFLVNSELQVFEGVISKWHGFALGPKDVVVCND